MSWTDPRTWLAGEDPTAALFNVQIRDNLKAIGDPWTAYTPVLTGSTTNPVLGNGSLVGAYLQAGKLVLWRFSFTSGTTTTYGSGNYVITLPVAMIAPTGYSVGALTIQNGGTFYQRSLFSSGSATQMSGAAQDGTRWSNASPYAPVAGLAGQRWSGYGFYEAA
jgi:hypothetical protein